MLQERRNEIVHKKGVNVLQASQRRPLWKFGLMAAEEKEAFMAAEAFYDFKVLAFITMSLLISQRNFIEDDFLLD